MVGRDGGARCRGAYRIFLGLVRFVLVTLIIIRYIIHKIVFAIYLYSHYLLSGLSVLFLVHYTGCIARNSGNDGRPYRFEYLVLVREHVFLGVAVRNN